MLNRNSFARCSLLALGAAVALTLAACASSSSLRVAQSAETAQNYDLAVAEYTKLLRENPNSKEARMGLERAKLRASQDHFTRAPASDLPRHRPRAWMAPGGP